MEQILRLYKSLDKLLILTFWEIIKSKNYTLLDIDYTEDKIYSESQLKEVKLLWDKLEDDYYLLNNNNFDTIKKSNDAFNLLKKIELLEVNLKCLTQLYDNIIAIPEDGFLRIEQKIYNNFTLIHKRIVPKYFDGLEVNYELIKKFINALQSDYEINYKIVSKEVEKEITNIYTIVASVSLILGYQINVKEVCVMEWKAYEETAKEKINAQKEANNGNK